MREKEVLEVLGQVNAVITESHIVYTSGRHGAAYVKKDAVYPHTRQTALLCRAIAWLYHDAGIEAVVAPAVGAIVLSQWTADFLSRIRGQEVLAVYADKDGEQFVIKRGYDRLIEGKRVLVVEDVITTGGSVKKVVEAARAIGCEVAGVAALCNRGGVTAERIGVARLISLVDKAFDSWDEDECPLCKQGIPVNTAVGYGREFLLRPLCGRCEVRMKPFKKGFHKCSNCGAVG